MQDEAAVVMLGPPEVFTFNLSLLNASATLGCGRSSGRHIDSTRICDTSTTIHCRSSNSLDTGAVANSHLCDSMRMNDDYIEPRTEEKMVWGRMQQRGNKSRSTIKPSALAAAA